MTGGQEQAEAMTGGQEQAEGGSIDPSLWIFGFGSLIHSPGFEHDGRIVGFIRGYRWVADAASAAAPTAAFQSAPHGHYCLYLPAGVFSGRAAPTIAESQKPRAAP